VLRGEAVPGGQHNGANLRGEAEAEAVDVAPRARAEAEAPAVEVDDHRQLSAYWLGAGRRLVHADAEVVGLVVDGLLPLHVRMVAGKSGWAELRVLRRTDDGAVAE
jgi:hypothetical protein